MSTITDDNFITVSELATYLRVSRSMAYKLVSRGEVPRVRVGGQWRIPRADLDVHLAVSARPLVDRLNA